MTLQQLEYIVALDTCRHFVTAAEKCFVTQPTLTMQVKKLEEELGIRIFNRCHKPLRPTPAGEKIISHAYRILREVNQMKEYVNNRKGLLAGTWRLGVIPSLAPYLLPLFLPSFIKEYPQVQLKVFEMQTADIIAALREDRLDMGLLVTPLEQRDILETALFEEPFLLYLPHDHPLGLKEEVNPADLDIGQMLVLTEGHCFRNQILNICGEQAQGGHHNFFYESGSIETLKRMVDQGMGYTLIPWLSAGEKRLPMRIRPFAQPQPVREVSLVYGHNFSQHTLLEKLAEKILQSIPAALYTGTPSLKVSIGQTQETTPKTA